MRKIISFIVFTTIAIVLYIAVDYATINVFTKYSNIQNFDLLLKYAFMIGYIFFIIFVFVLHQDQYNKLKEIKPKVSVLLNILYTVLSLTFLAYVFSDFRPQYSLLMVLFYMLITTGFDLFIEHKFKTQDTKVIYPKRII